MAMVLPPAAGEAPIPSVEEPQAHNILLSPIRKIRTPGTSKISRSLSKRQPYFTRTPVPHAAKKSRKPTAVVHSRASTKTANDPPTIIQSRMSTMTVDIPPATPTAPSKSRKRRMRDPDDVFAVAAVHHPAGGEFSIFDNIPKANGSSTDGDTFSVHRRPDFIFISSSPDVPESSFKVTPPRPGFDLPSLRTSRNTNSNSAPDNFRDGGDFSNVLMWDGLGETSWGAGTVAPGGVGAYSDFDSTHHVSLTSDPISSGFEFLNSGGQPDDLGVLFDTTGGGACFPSSSVPDFPEDSWDSWMETSSDKENVCLEKPISYSSLDHLVLALEQNNVPSTPEHKRRRKKTSATPINELPNAMSPHGCFGQLLSSAVSQLSPNIVVERPNYVRLGTPVRNSQIRNLSPKVTIERPGYVRFGTPVLERGDSGIDVTPLTDIREDEMLM